MKKLIALLLVIAMVFSLAACSKKEETQTSASDEPYVEGDPATILEEIADDFSCITDNLTQKLEETFTSVGSTYEDYQKIRIL